MTDENNSSEKRFVADKDGWPYAFGHWLEVVGIKNGQQLTAMDHYALDTYHDDWLREGIGAKIYYHHKYQVAVLDDDRKTENDQKLTENE